MSSILTNTSAMVALQNLRSINSGLEDTQRMISTGKSIGSARDNAAVWAISKVMESDAMSFKAINDSLNLGQSTVTVARQASETVTDLLIQMKEKIVSAQEENVDRTAIQDDVNALSDQIASVVGAAQFNGLNLIKGTDDVNILSSLDRAADGTVTAADITVARQDLSFDAGVMGTGASLTGGSALTAADAAATGGNVTIQAGAGQNFDDSSTRDFSNTANSMTVTVSTAQTAGDVFNLQVNGVTVSYTADSTTLNDVSAGLTSAINAAGIEDITASVTGAVITISSNVEVRRHHRQWRHHLGHDPVLGGCRRCDGHDRSGELHRRRHPGSGLGGHLLGDRSGQRGRRLPCLDRWHELRLHRRPWRDVRGRRQGPQSRGRWFGSR